MSDQFLNLQQIIRIDERVKQFVGFQLWEIHWPMHSDNKQLCLWFPKIDFQAFYKPQSKICIIMKSGVNNNCNNYVYNFSIFFMMKISIFRVVSLILKDNSRIKRFSHILFRRFCQKLLGAARNFICRKILNWPPAAMFLSLGKIGEKARLVDLTKFLLYAIILLTFLTYSLAAKIYY